MRKFVKFCFTLSALSAMEFIFVMLSDLRVRSAIVNGPHFWSESKGLKMKTYTLTWRSHASWSFKSIFRCRFDSLCSLWDSDLPNDKILQFVRLTSRFSWLDSSARLVKCGKLIARQATYQGV